ncbi:MAG: methylmalonyl-CoA carboxyltransferase [Actinobacteria bacterium]|nr:methylmalonyl-CoA carboxyltransferase [Actinomycetota bacterium]
MTASLCSPEQEVVVAGRRSDVVSTALRKIDGRTVGWFRIAGGKHHGAIGDAGGDAAASLVRTAAEIGVPIVGVLDTSGAELGEGVVGLHAWGKVAKAFADASGAVPTILAVTGACVSGPALLLGMVDQVVMTRNAFAYVTGPDSVIEFTGVAVSRTTLGGAPMHGMRSGVATFVVDDENDIDDAIAHLLSYLPSNHLEDPPELMCDDDADRPCRRAESAVPQKSSASYDMRTVLDDVVDDGSLLELRPRHAPNVITALAFLGGRSVGIVANQPHQRAGTIDIDASRKAARFVQWCDAFNLPILTFVDTPGFEPGKDLEWRGMIRHGAELVHAYAAATVPRLCVVVRKAYGGAYIVMDSKRLGSDWCIAWPGAEIAVMGAPGAVQILHGRRLGAVDDAAERAAEQLRLEQEYNERFANPYIAAERGFVDEVVEPADTRTALVAALERLRTKREPVVSRSHSNSPL